MQEAASARIDSQISCRKANSDQISWTKFHTDYETILERMVAGGLGAIIVGESARQWDLALDWLNEDRSGSVDVSKLYSGEKDRK